MTKKTKCSICEFEDKKAQQVPTGDWMCERCAWFWNKAYKTYKKNR